MNAFDPEDIQGNILRGYKLDAVRHIMLEVADRVRARQFLAAAADGAASGALTDVPTITRAVWKARPDVCFNIGITFAGLRALGTPANHLESFPREFSDGMAKRAMKLGDVGESAPQNWPAPFDRPERLHLVASVYANEERKFDEIEAQLAKVFTVLGVRNGRNLADRKVFFGYVDGISQPRFRHVFDRDMIGVDEPEDPIGTVLLGYPTHLEGLRFNIPSPDALGRNGSFNAFRVLRQDAAGFEAYLDKAADMLIKHPKVDLLLEPGAETRVGGGMGRRDALREVVAAQFCGRWRNGTPYELSPNTDAPSEAVSLTNYDYTRASRCPAASHMRRANPRGGPIVQRVANYTRRLVRRGMSYGPEFDPANPDTAERGLLGNFIGANYGAQFEAVVCDWLNLGLQDPEITGTNDPMLGANVPETSAFDLTLSDGGHIALRGFPRFVTTRGGAYTFLPSLTAIRYLSALTG